MKSGIHPEYKLTKVSCACGNVFETRSTSFPEIKLDLCSACHPFFTGKQKLVDTAGRVDRFRKSTRKSKRKISVGRRFLRGVMAPEELVYHDAGAAPWPPASYNPEGAMGVIAVKDENGKLLNVGGQAVIEGVMMRSPNSFAVCLRAPDGRIVLREDRWHSVWKRWKALRWPFFRGVIVLVEAMRNGINSLSFSAKWASSEDDNGAKNDEKPPETDPENPDTGISEWALVATMFVSFGFAIGLFVVLPHALTALLGFSTESWMFHAIDGVIKVAFLVGYIGLIGLMPDIKRVFQYHGAEHMAISTYEADLPLSVEHARKFTTFHPRCGTSFLFFVVAVSILVFSAIFPFLPQLPDWPKILRNIAYIGIKIPLMLPIAGISYEIIRLAGRRQENVLMRAVSQPGIWLQHLTTRRPTDDQLEVALLSLRKCLWRENIVEVSEEKVTEAGVRLYGSFQEASQAIQLAH